MIPVVQKDFVVRGVLDLPYLVNRRKKIIIPLEHQELVNLLMSFNGTLTIEEIANRFKIEKDELLSFIHKFEEVGAIDLNDHANEHSCFVALGPKQPWLREVHLDITNKCNLYKYCPHCFRGEKLNTYDDIEAGSWLSVFDDLSRIGAYQLTISGGEPFLRSDLPELVDYAFNKGMLVNAIFTNGTQSKSDTFDEVLKVIINNNIETTFYLSLDGFNEKSHDNLRGSGCFQKVIYCINKLVRLRQSTGVKFKVVVNSQINCYNQNNLEAGYKLISDLGVDRWRFTSGRLAGRLIENQHLLPELYNLFKSYLELIRFYSSEYEKNPDTMDINIESFFTSAIFKKKKALIFDQDIAICDYKQNACSIEPNGDVQFCTSWGGQNFGNVFKDSIESIWYGQKMQKIKQMKIAEISECQGCDFLKFCGGGCRIVAENLQAKDATACLKYQLFADQILPEMEKYGIEFSLEP